MWMLSLEWLLLAVGVFWLIGARKRLKRLRQAHKLAFTAVDVQCVQAIELLRSSARVQSLKDKVAGGAIAHSPQAVLLSADALEACVLQARNQPLRPHTTASLQTAWQAMQMAWHAYLQVLAADPAHAEQQQEWSTRWQSLLATHDHSTAQFNAAVHDYNRAIAQFPACALARISGLRTARTFEKDAALQMQPSA
jgi:LemA protein